MHRTRGTRALGRAAGSIQTHLAKAASHRAAGRFDKARSSLRLVIDAAPDHPAARYELGAIACQTGAPADAIQHFVAALRHAPERSAYWIGLAAALIAVERVAEARALLERYEARGVARKIRWRRAQDRMSSASGRRGSRISAPVKAL